jgi:hypothetical protein
MLYLKRVLGPHLGKAEDQCIEILRLIAQRVLDALKNSNPQDLDDVQRFTVGVQVPSCWASPLFLPFQILAVLPFTSWQGVGRKKPPEAKHGTKAKRAGENFQAWENSENTTEWRLIARRNYLAFFLAKEIVFSHCRC